MLALACHLALKDVCRTCERLHMSMKYILFTYAGTALTPAPARLHL